VEDVADGIVRVLEAPKPAAVYEFGGPDKLSYEDLLCTIAAHIRVKRLFLPMPYTAWHILSSFSEMLPQPLITRNQVDLMKIDNVASPQLPGFHDLGIEPQDIRPVLTATSQSPPL